MAFRSPQLADPSTAITINPGKLTTLNFNPDRSDLIQAVYDANDAVLKYFGIPPDHYVIDQITGGL